MASIMTNASALTALQSLNSTNKNLEITQSRISTGYRVAEASDNAAYWSIATTMRSDNKAMSTVQDALGLGASKVDTAYTGMNKAIETVNETQGQARRRRRRLRRRQGQDPDRDQGAAGPAEELRRFARPSRAPTGWRSRPTRPLRAQQRHRRCRPAGRQDRRFLQPQAPGSVSLGTIDVKVEGIKLFDNGVVGEVKNQGILDRTTRSGIRPPRSRPMTRPTRPAWLRRRRRCCRHGRGTCCRHRDAAATSTACRSTTRHHCAGMNDQFITSMLAKVEGALKDMTTAATNLGAAKSRIDLQKTFTTSLMDSDRARRRSARRCRHEQGIDPPPGPAGSAAARHPGAVDRQRQLAVDPVALQGLIPSSTECSKRAVRKRGPFRFCDRPRDGRMAEKCLSSKALTMLLIPFAGSGRHSRIAMAG